MPAHTWNCTNDYEYCTLTNCKIENGAVKLNNSLTGSVLSDIRDSTARIYDYAEIIPKIDTPLGTSAVLYIRSGWSEDYASDTWTEWKQVNEAETRMEYTLSLTNSKIVADYDINRLKNIYYRNDYRFMSLASSLKSLFIKGVNPNVPYADELYSILASAKVDEAIVGFAKVGHDSEEPTTYTVNASINNNVVLLKNVLPADSVNLIIEYIPRYFIYSENRNRYFQWRYDLVSTSTSITPIIRSVKANFRLDFQNEMNEEFPGFFRRL